MLERAQAVRLMIFDVDGVLTDGRIYINEQGLETKALHARDGLGLQLLKQSGLQLAIISGLESPMLRQRAKALGFDHLMFGVSDKRAAFAKLLAQTGFLASDCGYMGDDLPDLPVMRQVAFAAAVPDSPALVRQHAHYVTGAQGGDGAVREVCELIMQSQGTFAALLAPLLADEPC